MKLIFLFFLFSSSALAASFPERDADFALKKGNVETTKFTKGEYKDTWTAILPVCWNNKRIVKCSPEQETQKLNIDCTQVNSANCSDVTCDYDEKAHAINGASVVKGENRDFILLKGVTSGCGGTNFSLAIVNESGKVLCKFNKGYAESGNDNDEKAGNLIASIYKNYRKYLKWKSEDACDFSLSAKEKKILDAAQ
jgi:hypothetical protein